MTVSAVAASAPSIDSQIAARIERLPFSSWHVRVGLIIGSAWFFDAFDALAIAYVLPVLIPLWKLVPGQIGVLISIGYLGQIFGSLFFGWLAQKIGRVPCMIYTIAIFSLMSVACIFAWDCQSLLSMRFLQGLGLGGEVPIIATYVNEFVNAERRGRISLGCQVLFVIGLVLVALAGVWVVPTFGWQGMFVLGAVPALITVPMRRILPESPRWLASKGRVDEADRILTRIEADISQGGKNPLPPIPRNIPAAKPSNTRLSVLFKDIYLRRTISIWVLWVCTYLITYGLAGWLPSIYRTVYHLSVQQALTYGFIVSVAGLIGGIVCILLVDYLGRKPLFTLAQFISAIPLLILARQPDIEPFNVLLLVAIGFGFNNILALGLAMYTAESYPTELRALGSGVAGAVQRLASMLGPFLVGAILPAAGLGAVFGVFGGVAILGALVTLLLAVETRGKVLEQLSPSL